MGCPPASKVGSLALFLLFLSSQAHSTHSLVSDGPGYSLCLLLPGAQREAGRMHKDLRSQGSWVEVIPIC